MEVVSQPREAPQDCGGQTGAGEVAGHSGESAGYSGSTGVFNFLLTRDMDISCDLRLWTLSRGLHHE